MLMSAKAMSASMIQLKPFFASGELKTKGTFIIGTVKGDLHDIGKNLVSMIVEGGGWTLVDLGVDVSSDRFIDAIRKNPGAIVGLSALLTTTMGSIAKLSQKLKRTSRHQSFWLEGLLLIWNFVKPLVPILCSKSTTGDYLNSVA